MSLDDFKDTQDEEDKTEGDEAYEGEVWEKGLDDANKDDNAAVEAGTIEKDKTIEEVEKELKGEPVEDEE